MGDTFRGVVNELLSIICITILSVVILHGIDAEQERRENEAIKRIQTEESRRMYHGFDSRKAYRKYLLDKALAEHRAQTRGGLPMGR